jgi:hypothetical protein
MSEIIKWNTIKDRINKEKWAGELYTKTIEDLDLFIENYHDEASRVTGWFHHYNCEKCQGRLIFNMDDMENHECSVCHHINSSETLTRVWNNMYRGRANQSVFNSAVAYRISEDEKYPKHIEKILDFYSANYDDFISDPIAKRFEGKLMNQHLDDASSMMNIMLGLSMVRDNFSEEKFKYWYENLFKREAELFDFFANRIYNIPVWVKCAQAMTGVFFNEPEHIKKGFYSMFGVLDQLKKGVTEEGMWYEGSMHYHFYTIQPIAYLMFICRAMDFDIPEMPYIYDTVEKMFEYPVKMMFESKRLPNPNDAHPYLDIYMYRTHYEYASVIYDNPMFRKLCSMFNQDSQKPGSFTSLLLNTWNEKDTDIKNGTVINPDSCTAMLRKDGTEVFFKFGTLTHLHMHPDVMNFEMSFDGDVVSYDIGNGGYASSLFVEWQRKTLCHNTALIDQTDHVRRNLPRGSVEDFDIENAYIKAKAKAVYEATDFTRSFRVSRDRVLDEFEVHNWDTHEIDWFFYCEGEQKCSYTTEKVETLAEEFLKDGMDKEQIMMPPRQSGYQHLLDVEKFSTDEKWHIDFELPDKTIRVSMEGEQGTTVYLFDSYTANKEKKRRGIMVRRTADKTTFKTTYECIRK